MTMRAGHPDAPKVHLDAVSLGIPRILIAGSHSGCGKTTVSSGIMAALTARGLRVQPFKVGPDFIDPTHHSAICGRTSRNLDPFMMGEAGVRSAFLRGSAGADIAVIEGVMGLFDGLDGTEISSTAHVAKLLDAPVLIVADVRGTSRSVHALVQGFESFDPEVRIAGVIFNRVGSERHRTMIEKGRKAASFGCIPRTPEIEVGSRHLGLAMAHEADTLRKAGALIEENCDLDAILSAASTAGPISAPTGMPRSQGDDWNVRIGVARDEAFCFYYADNLDRLARAGAELVFFSPMRDALPELDGLYLGGGYPELHAAELFEGPARIAIREAAANGMPVYGECGGLLYLAEHLETDRVYPMAGVLPADASMERRMRALGYSEGRVTDRAGLLPRGLIMRGHEFHYSEVSCADDARFSIRLDRGQGIRDGHDGLSEHVAMGCYTHTYFSDRFAKALVAAARRYRWR